MAPPTRYPNTEVRRAAVRAALHQHQGQLTMVHRRQLATRYACTPAVIAHDIQMVLKHEPAYRQAPQAVQVSSFTGLTNERDTVVLRTLGRLEVLTSAHIKTLVFPDTTIETMRIRLNRLREQGLVWRTTTSLETIDPPEAGGKRRQPPPKAPYVYGLTHEGKALLESLNAEPHAPTYELLKSRDRRAPEMPQTQLTHDLIASSWCCSVIDMARRCALLVDIRCHVEYVAATDAGGKEKQRFDAYLALRFTRKARPQTLPGWWLPWYDGEAGEKEDITVRFALEVDRATEKLAILLGKAVMYRDLTLSGHYTKALEGNVTPVLLVPRGLRSAQIAREWKEAWPKGAGVISTPEKASNPVHGALWGEYLTMTDTPAKPYKLLGNLFPSVEAWANTTRTWVPGTPVRT